MLKRLKEMFDDNQLWLSRSSVSLIGDWSDLTTLTAIDHRLYNFYKDKAFDRDFASLDNEAITIAVADFINSRVYELDKLHATMEVEYDPIQNYSMSEEGTDTTEASSEGNTTEYATSYNSSAENKTGKSEAGGSSSTTLTHFFTRSGNVGVTTSQQMIVSEREVANFDFVGYVVELVVHNFTMTQYFPESDMYGVIL